MGYQIHQLIQEHGTHNVDTCAELTTQQLWGSDWDKIDLIESKEPQEVIDNGGGECCGRKPPTCNSAVDCCQGDKHSQNGGTNDKCPVNGKCGPDNNNACIQGTYDNNDSNDGNDPGKWICRGINTDKGATDSGICGSSCDPNNECCDGDTNPPNSHCPIETHGLCSTTDPSGCAPGDREDQGGGTWICKSDGGDNSGLCGCTTPVTGVCSVTGCSAGTKQDNNDGTWTCKGDCTGNDAPDNPCPLDGKCSDSGCDAGTPDKNPQRVSSTETWICKGIGTGNDSNSCPRDGECNTTGCAVGNPNPNPPPDTDGTWICEGIAGGRNSETCGETSPPCAVDGVCSVTGCFAGTPDKNPIPNPGTWTCLGTDINPGCSKKGKNSETCGCDPASECCPGQTCTDNPTRCECPPSPEPVCGSYNHTTSKGECREGDDIQLNSTNTHHRWQCKNADGKTKVCPPHAICDCSTCSPSEPSCLTPTCSDSPECSNCGGHGSGNDGDCCSVGVFHGHPADTSTQCLWQCRKSLQNPTGADSCSAQQPPPPECGNSPSCDNCARGGSNGATGCCKSPAVFHGHPADTPSTSFECQWTCRKSANDSSGAASCNVPKPLPVCTCGSAIDTCSSGCTAVLNPADSSWTSTDHPQGRPGDIITIENKVDKWKCVRGGDLNTASAVCQHATTRCHTYAHTDTVKCLEGDRKIHTDGNTVIYPEGVEECTAQTTGPTSCNFLQCASQFHFGVRNCGCNYVTCNVHPVN